MTLENVELQVLLIEDNHEDMQLFLRDLPEIFETAGVKHRLHPCESFSKAFDLISDPSTRYDLVISDTYKGETALGDSQGLEIVENYQRGRFCPLLIISSGAKPPDLTESPFLIWADKTKPKELNDGIENLLKTHIPQLARLLHDELDRQAGSYLWEFLDKYWEKLQRAGLSNPDVLERLVRKRAAIKLGDINPGSQQNVQVMQRDACEFYIYPPISQNTLNLGDVIRSRTDNENLRVVLTPHCHLTVQPSSDKPRAEFVLTAKVVSAKTVLGERATNAISLPEDKKHKKLRGWSKSPADTGGRPTGRHWYLPAFLDIPHGYCDLLQIESLPYAKLNVDYEVLATIVTPFAEALQSCFVSFYGAVGIATVRPESIESLLD